MQGLEALGILHSFDLYKPLLAQVLIQLSAGSLYILTG